MQIIDQQQIELAATGNGTLHPVVEEFTHKLPTIVRQLVLFPPDGLARRSGLVREYFVLLELGHGTVYHLQISCDWCPDPDELHKLAELLKTSENYVIDPKTNAAKISWELGVATLQFLDLDVASPVVENWPLRAAALERCRLRIDEPVRAEEFADRVASAQQELKKYVKAAVEKFVSELDGDILALAAQWDRLPLARFNYFASARDEKVRRYRVQAAKVVPALVTYLISDVSSNARRLSKIVDAGEPLASGLVSAFEVRPVTARHVLGMPAQLAGDNELSTLTRNLDVLIPERFPQSFNEWNIFRRLVYDVIPKISDGPLTSSLNCAILAAVSRRGWAQAEQQLSRLCINDNDKTLFTQFSGTYRKSLAWDIGQSGTTTATITQEACITVVDQAIATVGVRYLFEAARLFPALLREADGELCHRHEMLRGHCWETIFNEPVILNGCEIEEIATVSSLTSLASELSNCLSEYANACAENINHVFTVRDNKRRLLGAVSFRFHPDRRGDFLVEVCECKGASNRPMCDQGQIAVAIFGNCLMEDAAQRRIRQIYFEQFLQRERKSDVEKQIEMESRVMALRRMRHKALRFDVLRAKVLALLASAH